MTTEYEEQIKNLKERIETLERQKQILFDAVDIVSMADGIIMSLRSNDIIEAIKKIEYIRNNAIDSMKQVVSLNNPFTK